MTQTENSSTPVRDCDVVMKGGITSGVIYPGALVELAKSYRLRGLGGASAGAIGAAVGAAAEYGRESGGFDQLAKIPSELGNGALGDLFQPQAKTRQLMRLLETFLDNRPAAQDPPKSPPKGRLAFLWRALAWLANLARTSWRGLRLGAAVTAIFPLAALLGVLPGLACVVVGLLGAGADGWLLAALGLLVVLLGWLAAIGYRLWRKVTVDVPANLFGICRGLSEGGTTPGFTDWLADAIDRCAGLPLHEHPLTFGDLWAAHHRDGTEDEADDLRGRDIDLRMVTTCLSLGRPFELPMEARFFFYEPHVWETLFPAHVMTALERASDPLPSPGDRLTNTQWEEAMAARQGPSLKRLPYARLLPVIVATRLSLSFPGLISAVPLWAIDRVDDRSRVATLAFAKSQGDGSPHPASGLVFSKVWFSDGGLCSNFPVHLFDAPLSTRPTFAINLGGFPEERPPSPNEAENIDYARTNRDGLVPSYSQLPEKGFGALKGFAGLAIDTARNWQDSSHLDFPGDRDRIVRVLQTAREGGLNLNMEGPTIDRLGKRGTAAATAMVEQFGHDHFSPPTATGWDNHRWVRYRALLSCLPDWLESYGLGRATLDIQATRPPSYRFSTTAGRQLAEDLAAAMDAAAAVVADADPVARADLTGVPNPQGMIRRIPRT